MRRHCEKMVRTNVVRTVCRAHLLTTVAKTSLVELGGLPTTKTWCLRIADLVLYRLHASLGLEKIRQARLLHGHGARLAATETLERTLSAQVDISNQALCAEQETRRESPMSETQEQQRP